jgi:hypothetical protein
VPPPAASPVRPPAVRPSATVQASPGNRPGREGPLFERPYRSGRGHGPALSPGPSGTAPAVAPTPAAPRSPKADPDSDSVYGSARRVMRVLPLGAGLALVGLGLGFLGLRLRRG